MTMHSDPQVDPMRATYAQPLHRSAMITPGGTLVALTPDMHRTPTVGVAQQIGRRFVIVSVVATVVVSAVMSMLSSIATPLVPAGPAAADPWMIEMSVNGPRPITAIVYGREAGLHVVRVPPASTIGTPEHQEPRMIAARVDQGDVYMVGLSWRALQARGTAPKGSPVSKWSASAHMVKIYQNKNGAGVIAGW